MDTNILELAQQMQAVKDGTEALWAIIKTVGGASMIAIAGIAAFIWKNKHKFLNSTVLKAVDAKIEETVKMDKPT